MESITFDKFKSGLDLRKSNYTAGADSMRELLNCFVNAGYEVEKRECLALQTTLEEGTVGLVYALGVFNTFSASYPFVTHADTNYICRAVPHPTDSARAVQFVHYADAFFGYLYCAIEYDNGDIYHHYLDDPGEWVASTNYALGNFRRPTVPNGFRYEVTADAGSAGGSEPTWPTTVGSTVVDGGITWTCRSYAVTDANCPHTHSVVQLASSIWAIDGEYVRKSAVAAARDWTTSGDAGFLAVTANQSGAGNATAVAEFKTRLAVFFADSVQIWSTDPDPALCVLQDKIFSSGTLYDDSIVNVGQDTIYQSEAGFRSIALNADSLAMEDTDVGSPIDKAFQEHGVHGDVQAFWLSRKGQYICADADNAWVYTYSRVSKLAAWSQYAFPRSAPDQMTVKSGELYGRYGPVIVRFARDQYQDYDTESGLLPPRVVVQFPLIDCKAPGLMKMFIGFDVAIEGTVNVSFRWIDENQVEHETDALTVTGFTPPGVMIPMEMCAVAIAPRFVHQRDEPFVLSRLTLYYQRLGAQ